MKIFDIKYNLKHIVGRIGEVLAIIFYVCTFHSVIGYRVRNKCGEVDIICQRFNTLVFVEVKSRSSGKIRNDDFVVSYKQRSRIVSAARLFLASNPKYQSFDIRFDLVIVKFYVFPVIIKDAWQDFA